MKNIFLIAIIAIIASVGLKANPTLTIKEPKANETYRIGKTITIAWDTLSKSGERTWKKTFEFKWAESESGTWSLLALAKNAKSFKDSSTSNSSAAVGRTVITLPRKTQIWIRMNEVGNESNYAIVGPINIYTPPPAVADSLIGGDLTGTITLSSKKLYQLKKVLYVKDGATLRIEPGTVVLGDPNDVSAIVIERGAKIYANGTPNKPIVLTSGFAPGNRDRGDWGGLIVCGKASTNIGEAAIEGGLNVKYGPVSGVADDNDSSGVIKYVRIEFAGIAESPDNELNSLTMGGVGRKTVISHVMVSYAGDDAYEWFGGTVNAKHLIAYNTIDDDMDTDNGFSGKVQHVFIKRFPEIADQSSSEGFESDNDSKSSENQPFTRPVFANVTVVGPLADTSWTAGTGDNKYHAKHLAAVQVRRNSRMNLVNSVIAGYNAGVELTGNNTVRAAANDSIMIRYNSFFGIKNNKYFYFGSGTNPQGSVDANWLSNESFGNQFVNAQGNINDLAHLTNAFTRTSDINPLPKSTAPYLTTANWTASNAAVNLNDPFFDKVPYRGAFGTDRWDLPWAEYDPINKIYTAETGIPVLTITSPKANETYRIGQTVAISWDTLDSEGNRTWNKTFEFKWAENENGPWNLLALAKNAKSYKDRGSDTTKASGRTVVTFPRKPVIYIRMSEVGNETLQAKVGPINVFTPPPAVGDSILQDAVTSTVTLNKNKIYQLKKVLYVEDGGTLRIDPGTIILGDPNDVSAIVIKRGAKIYAKGTPELPIIMTSGFAAGNRDRGDWGGLIIAGKASTNIGEAAIEGGLDVKYGPVTGVADDNDSSGVVQYVRIEFAGIAESPDNELNSLTMGGVGRRTVISHIMVSYAGDDAFEWFGGTVNAKNLIAYNTIDDDMDTDNGFSGKIQHVIIKRFAGIADQSSSEAFESDNDSKSSENQPFTRPIFSNVTVIGPMADTSWTSGTGANKYHSKHLTAAQIRRNSRLNLVNSVIMGYPAGVELTGNNTVRAAANDSIMIRYNDFYGIKNNKFFYFGSGTNAQGNVDGSWLAKEEFGNRFINNAGNVGSYAHITNAFPGTLAEFNPMPTSQADFMNNANWTVSNAAVNLNDSYFDKVAYRGAFGTERWDLPWAEYDPVNKDYIVSVKDDYVAQISNITVEAAPLPAAEYSVVTYQLPSSREVTIRLIDVTGSINSTFKANEFQNAGVHQFMLNTSALQSGIYYLQIQSNEGSATISIPVVK